MCFRLAVKIAHSHRYTFILAPKWFLTGPNNTQQIHTVPKPYRNVNDLYILQTNKTNENGNSQPQSGFLLRLRMCLRNGGINQWPGYLFKMMIYFVIMCILMLLS